MHTQNQLPNVGPRQVQFNGPAPPRPPFMNQGMPYGQQPRGQNPNFYHQLPPNVHYTQLPLSHGSSVSDSATSPPSVASTPGLPPPLINNGNPLQPGPAVYYQQPPPPQRFIPPQQQQQQQQFVYVQIPNPQHQQQGGPRPRGPFGQRPPAMIPFQNLPPNFNMNQRFPVSFNPQAGMPLMDGQFFDPSLMLQQQQQPPQHYQKNNYRGGKNGRGNGNSNQSSRRGSIRHDGRSDPNRPSPRPSPDLQLPQFVEQNVPIQQGQIMQQNPTYSLSQFPPAMIPPPGQQFFIQQQYPQEAQMGQPFYVLQGDPSNYHQQNQYYPAFQMVVPPQQMQQQQLPMDPQHQQPPPQFLPLSHTDDVDSQTLMEALEELKLEKVKEQHNDSPERIEPAAVPALDAVSVEGDVEDYTPAGTPQSLNPLDGQQMEQILDGLMKSNSEISNQTPDEKTFEKEDNKGQESQRKRNQKPEQQHYQPPQQHRGDRANAQRTSSWRSTTSQQSAQLTKIAEEKPKATYPTGPLIFEPSKPTSVPSDTPTPRASPTPPPKPKEVIKTADVPMIGNVPLIGGKPLGAAVKSESTNEHCSYCEMLGKARHEITNHSTYSSKNVPACPIFRIDGCKLCGAKGDSAHLEKFCKKQVNKENVDFKNMANQLMNMPPNEKSAILIKDMGNHPTVQQIESHPDEEYQNRIDNSRMNLFVAQAGFHNHDRPDFEQKEIAETQQQAHAMAQRQYYDDRNYRGDDRFYRGGRGGGPRGGGDHRGGRGYSGQTYIGSRSRDGSRGGNSGGGNSRGSGGNRGGGQYGGSGERRGGGGGSRYRN